jgi:hypothetical protein
MSTDKPIHTPDKLPDHESGLRRMFANAHGLPYQPLRSLEEARSHPDGIVILEGDDGGQIYVVCPAPLIKCSEEILKQLLRDLDAIAWPGNDPAMAHAFYERRPLGSKVPGGMGGAPVTQGIWVHEDFIKLGLESVIQEVIRGKRARISQS